MDKKYLNKVVEQMVSESKMGHDKSVMDTPFYTSFPTHLFFVQSTTFLPTTFSTHCREVYGLNKEETRYTWKEYTDIIKDKIEDNE
tara:strand:- start:477 stop:734 length:258 start_codon:yes stop_codon:yes gene_type:complete